MLDKMVDVAKAAGSLAASRRTERRANWDRVADHLELIAAALDDAAAAIRAGEVPYRQYAALQRFAATFEDVAFDALRNLPPGQDLQDFLERLHDALYVIAASDLRLIGFTEVPFPDGLLDIWRGKSMWLDEYELPPANPQRHEHTPPLEGPSVMQLEETAATFRAQASVVRTRRL